MLATRFVSFTRMSNFFALIIITALLATGSLLWFSDTFAVKPPKPPAPDPGGDLEIATAVNDWASRKCKPNSNFLLLSADGSTTKTILRECECILRDPCWSPDGSRIVYTAYPKAYSLAADKCSGGYGINTVNKDGKDVRHVLTILNVAHPMWSPDISIGGEYWIAYVDEQASGDMNDICMIPVNSLGDPIGASINLTNTADSREGAPSWSPSAERLVYNRSNITAGYPDFTPTTIVIRDLWTDIETIIPAPYPDFGLIGNIDWASTGDKLVIVTALCTDTGTKWEPGPLEIWVIDMTTDPISFTMLVDIGICCSNGLSVSPSWSSDDSQIVYQANDGIYVIDSSGGTPVRISGEDQAGAPDWKR